jgi:WD40 repeat protein
MVMAVKLARHQRSQNILLLAGYEGGVAAAFKLPDDCTSPSVGSAELIYLSQPHTQPVLSLDASPDGDFFFTSSADAKLAMHRVPELTADANDGQNNTTMTLPSTPASQTLGTTEDTTQKADSSESTLSFPKLPANSETSNAPKPGGLSSLLSSSSTPLSRIKPAPPVQVEVKLEPPYKAVDTKHAGQQSLRVRSDGRLIITGGWDARIRIYSSKTLKEVAVLKWHKEGVYAVAFAEILTEKDLAAQDAKPDKRVVGRGQEREAETKIKHWVAAGAKDGKVSLWEIF